MGRAIILVTDKTNQSTEQLKKNLQCFIQEFSNWILEGLYEKQNKILCEKNRDVR